MQLLHDGVIGKVYLAKGLCYKRRQSIGHAADAPVPPGVDWDKFLGPAPMRAFNELRFKYNWHWFWDTGNGDIGNQGIHRDGHRALGPGRRGLPKSVVSTGGKYVYDDDQETPNTLDHIARIRPGPRDCFRSRAVCMTGGEGGLQKRGGNVIGNLFYGSDGWMALDDAGFQVYKGEKDDKTMDEKNTGKGDTGPHMANFLASVKSRKFEDLHADVAIGVMSADLVHFGNISYRLNRRVNYDQATKRFVNDKEADAMLTRKYRAPYIVPDKV